MLKYLFTAKYKDGSTYSQNVDDRSVTDPLKRSCFFDIKQDELATFTLDGEGHSYMVDLQDGHFEVNGVRFTMHEEPLADFRLIFWRAHTHQYRVTQQAQPEELDHQVVYRMGWQCTKEEKNYQRVMEIN